jgi:hypothetical protein
LISTKLETFSQIVELNNPRNILKKGYALIRHNNQYIKSIKDLQLRDDLTITLQDGDVTTKILKLTSFKSKVAILSSILSLDNNNFSEVCKKSLSNFFIKSNQNIPELQYLGAMTSLEILFKKNSNYKVYHNKITILLKAILILGALTFIIFRNRKNNIPYICSVAIMLWLYFTYFHHKSQL